MGVCSLIYTAPPSPNAESGFEECGISSLLRLKTIFCRHVYRDRRKMSRRLSSDEEYPFPLFFHKTRRLMNDPGASCGVSTSLHDIFPESYHPRMFLSGVQSEFAWIPLKACGNNCVRIRHCAASCGKTRAQRL